MYHGEFRYLSSIQYILIIINYKIHENFSVVSIWNFLPLEEAVIE